MPSKKIIITDELKSVLTKINSDLSRLLLQEEIDESVLSKPEKNFNYLDLSHTEKGHLSYLNGDRIEKIKSEEGNYWDVKSRFHGRPGSVIKKIFKTSDWAVEQFTTQFLSIVDPPIYKLEIVEGEDIAKYYDYHNYYNQSGALGSSCMKCSPANFFDIYKDNPKQIKMLVMLDQHDKVMGRALIWYGDGFKLMDRIYVCNDMYQNYFYNWAKENNCYYKQYNNWLSPKNLMFNGEPVIKHMEISIDNVVFERYPYLDTFKWLDIKNKRLYNYIPTDKEIYTNDLITISDHTGRFFERNYFKFSDLTNNLHLYGDIIYVDYMKMNIYIGDCLFSDVLNRYIYHSHTKEVRELHDDVIFNSEYDQYNDHELIEKRKKEIEEKKSKGEYNKGYSSHFYFNEDIFVEL